MPCMAFLSHLLPRILAFWVPKSEGAGDAVSASEPTPLGLEVWK